MVLLKLPMKRSICGVYLNTNKFMKYEIKGLFSLPSGILIPRGLNIKEKLWWYMLPGVIFNVKWPVGDVVVGPNSRSWSGMGPMYELVHSADPNDHYRPYLEKHVGKQGVDWNWGMANRDATDNRLTIKVRQKHQKYATILSLMWN